MFAFFLLPTPRRQSLESGSIIGGVVGEVTKVATTELNGPAELVSCTISG